MDAHSVPDENYIKYCVEDLELNRGMNVGGLWLIKPSKDNWISESIALAASHPFGVGDAKYRYSKESAYVETVPFGSFFRSTFDKIGFFNEELLVNEDYEFNVRISNYGGKIFFDPRIKIDYYARGDFSSLAKQYWRYGYWKFKMLQIFPDTIRWRQAIPPLFVVSLIFLAIASIFLPLALSLLLGELGLYLLLLVIGSLRIVIDKNKWIFILGIPFSIIVMHFSWGLGFFNQYVPVIKRIIKIMANIGLKQRLFWRLRQGERKFILLSGDVTSSFIAMFLALFFWARGSEEWLNFSWQFLVERPPTWFYFLPVLWILLLSGMYDLRKANKYMETISGIAMSTLLSGSVYLFVFFLATPKTLPRFGVAVFFIGSAIITFNLAVTLYTDIYCTRFYAQSFDCWCR